MNAPANREDTPTQQTNKRLALLLASLTALTPLAIDAYLPALPGMATWFRVDIQLIEMSISTFFLGYASGQLIGAPFSDHFGRRPIVFAGLALFLVASGLILLSRTAEQLLLLRFLQAFGGGAAAVNTAAIVRDLYDERGTASMFALIGLIMMVAPLLAPALGTVVLLFADWRMIFAVLMAYAFVLFVNLYFRLPETNVHNQPGASSRPRPQPLQTYLRVLRTRPAMALLIGASFAYGCMFVFLTDAAFAYMDYFGISEKMFPLLFGANIVLMMLLTRINLHMLRSSGPRRIIRIGSLLQVAATLALVIHVVAFEPRLTIVVPLIMVAIGANGLIVGNSMAAYLAYFPTGSGAASALFTTAGFLVGGGLGAFIGVVHDGTLRTMAFGMFASASVVLLIHLTAVRPAR